MMKSSIILVLGLYVLVMFLTGCAHTTSPIEPCDKDAATPALSGSRTLLGLYTFICEPDTGALDVIPQREVELHLNALKFLEPPALVYLTLEGPPQINGNILDVNIGLTNPYLGFDQFTGFDVCGIVFTHGSVTGFNDPDIVMAGDGDTRLLNADGYTRWWNPAEFPHGDTIFNYKDGMLGTPADQADFNCTINGYKYFADGLDKNTPLTALEPAERGVFSAGMKNIRHYTIEMSSGLIFNYAVDACWAVPQGDPPYNVPDDFPQKANRPEAWNLTITELENDLYYEESTGNAGGDLSLLLDVWDHFGASLNQVHAESLAGLPLTTALTPMGGGEGYSTYELDLTGENLAKSGEAELLITVQSEKSGYGGALPGKPVCAYFQYTFNILTEKPYDPCDPDLDAPDTFIDYGCEDQPADTTEITLGVSGIDPNDCTPPEDLTYEWRKAVNGGLFGPWQAGDGPEIIINGLFHGDWAIEVRAVDLADNKDPTPAECLFYIPPDSNPVGWAVTWGGEQYDFSNEVVADNSSNSYVTGNFRETVDFDPGDDIQEYTSNGKSDMFLSKFNPPGKLLWAVAWGGEESDLVNSVALDDLGYAYVCGKFRGTVDFDPGPGNDEHIAYPDQCDVFLSKFDSNGEFQWARTWGGTSDDEGLAVATDHGGGVYVTGYFYETCDFDPGDGVDEHTNVGPGDIFLSKFDSNGEFQWARTWGPEDDGNACIDEGFDVVVDGFENVYVTGEFHFTCDFDPGPEVEEYTVVGENPGNFLSKFNSSGDFLWARVWSGLGGGKCTRGIAVSGNDEIYITGYFYGECDFDPGPDIYFRFASDNSDVYLTKFDSNGDFKWARTWGNCSGYQGDALGNGVAVDASGFILVTGCFEGACDFDPGPGIDEHITVGDNYKDDVFLSKYNSDGIYQWTRTWGDIKHDSGVGVSVGGGDNVFVAGNFQLIPDFDPGPGTDFHESNGKDDVFLVRFQQDGYWE